uniref:Integrase catalytic domain-containing protein n=1 Tax=Tanacetum cinerariifolium TaxID=118510 RepID=A0A6L2KMT4_TANCI|nr:hypothetical protein [Tanacetum cinerariifolium]
MGKSKKKSHKPKSEDTNQEKLYLLHMDLCGPMCIESINGKKYILVIVDDYSRFTWVKFLRSKDEAPNFIIKFLKMIQVRLKVPVCRIRTNNGTEFVNQTLREYYEEVGISHETSVACSPQQNGVVERRNRTLIEAARAMLIYTQASLFLWAEAVATACYTQNRSIIRLRHEKTPYELLHNKLPNLSYLHVFGALCYPTNDNVNLGKLQPMADIGIFIDFDELTAMASEQSSSGTALNEMTPVTISSTLMQKPSSSTPYVPPLRNDWDLLFQPMFDELLNPPPIDQDAPSPSKSQTIPETQSSVIPQDVKEDNIDIEVSHMGNDPLFAVPIPEMSMMGKISFFLRLQISQSSRGIFINQSKYALESLKKYGFESCDPVDTPMVEKSKLDEDKEGKSIDPSHYRGSAYQKARTCSKKDLSIPMRDCSSRTMDTTINQQVTRDEALVPYAKRLRIGRSNFCLLSDIKSKESTLQLVYDVLRLTSFFKAFLVTADVLKIYMQEFWATTTVHHHYIRFKMDNKKHVVLGSFREMLHIYPRLPHQPFVEPPFEEEILAFLCFLGHSAVIKKLTDVNINKLHQPWRAFAAIINKGLTRKSSGYDSLRNSNAYKEYYAVAIGATPPKPKASVRKTRSSSDTTITPPTAAAGLRMTTSEKANKQLKLLKPRVYLPSLSSGADEGTGSIPGVPDVPTDESGEEISWNSTDEEGDDDEGKYGDGNDDDNGDDGEEGDGDGDDEDDDGDNDQEDEGDDGEDDEEDEGSDDEQASDEEEFIHPSLCTHAEEETRDEESFDPISKTPEDNDDEGNAKEDLGLNVGREEGHDEEEEEVELHRNFNINQGRGIQTTQEIKDSHVTLTSVNPDGNDEFLKTIDENMQKIIKEQVKEQVKVQVSKILPRIEQTVNDQLEAEVLTRSSNSSKTSYVVVADLFEMELKKILIEKMEGNKSIHRSNEQRNLYKALVEAYESDKIILDTYGETVTLKRRHDDDADKDEEPSAGSDWGSKSRREGKEPKSASALQETTTRSAGRSRNKEEDEMILERER